ncbi:unnamed protein product, partial [Ectocarpus fasciculatus]
WSRSGSGASRGLRGRSGPSAPEPASTPGGAVGGRASTTRAGRRSSARPTGSSTWSTWRTRRAVSTRRVVPSTPGTGTPGRNRRTVRGTGSKARSTGSAGRPPPLRLRP